MKIEEIKIEHFRGILEAELEFDSQLNVFIGGNGAGKTTMLRAIGLCIYQLTKHYDRSLNSFFRTSDNEINYKKSYFAITSFAKLHSQVDQLVLLALSQGIPNIKDKEKKSSIYQIAEKNKKSFIKAISQNKLTVPIVKFYPANRGSNRYSSSNRNKVYNTSQLETWSNFYHNDVSYSKFFKWFFDYETQELRQKRDMNDMNVESKELKHIRIAIQKALSFLQKKQFKVKSNQTKRTGNNELIPTLTLENIQTGESEDLNAKSDGEKAIITLVADIAYNLSIAKDFSEGNDYLSSPGIVLIDEIEAHLHPNWQREIIPLLTQLFPNIQFFITTHSPQILSSVESQHVFICEDFEFSKINIKSKGLDSNSLLKYVFNSTERPKKYVELIEKFDSIIEEEGEIEELQAIIAEIKTLNSDDKGQDIDLLVNDLNLQIEAYKFDLAHEID